MAENTGREIGWDDQIENEGAEFTVLPAGDCEFEVLSFERARHSGSDKLPPCNKAVLHIQLTAQDGSTTTVNHNLFLHSITEGMLCSFFTAIGQRQKGERATMNWNAVTGSRGRCKITVRKWKGDDGVERESNQINKFYEPETAKYQAGRF
jgi:hypothetical protein